MQIKRTDKLLRQRSANKFDLTCGVDAVKDHGKFIAAKTVRLMTFFAKLDHPFGGFDQYAVTRGMTPGVIDNLKVITVQEEQGRIGFC